MDKFIEIVNIKTCQNKVKIDINCSQELDKYFNKKCFWALYSEDITKVSPSILSIPIIVQLLPISWLVDCKIIIDMIDKDFYDAIPKFKEGYKKMYPHLNFLGSLDAKRIIHNELKNDNNSGLFFSGGADAFATLFSHIEEKPTLITVRGADISLNDETGWNVVTKHAIKTAQNFNLNNIFIQSNFTSFLNQDNLNILCKEGGDSWWHGFQHGIGLIGLAAPLALKYEWSFLYIASSFTPKDKGKVTCASDPDIDGNVRFGGCIVVHDCYELSRLEKVKLICKYSETNQKKINVRVCYAVEGGKNCCFCEKCIRTIFEIYASGYNPKDYGFEIIPTLLKHYKLITLARINKITLPLWNDIQDTFHRNPKLFIPHELNWIKTINITEEQNSFRFKISWFLFRLKSKILRMIH